MSGQNEGPGKDAAPNARLRTSSGGDGATTRAGSELTNGGLIVGIGASAGGLAAFSAFLAAMPPDNGMAFLLVQHLAPDHKSILTELLGKVSPMPVVEAHDGMPVDADRVFVIAPDSTLAIKDRRLQVSRPAPHEIADDRSTHFFPLWPKTRETMRSASSWLAQAAMDHSV